MIFALFETNRSSSKENRSKRCSTLFLRSRRGVGQSRRRAESPPRPFASRATVFIRHQDISTYEPEQVRTRILGSAAAISCEEFITQQTSMVGQVEWQILRPLGKSSITAFSLSSNFT